jgi:hypothetical protein
MKIATALAVVVAISSPVAAEKIAAPTHRSIALYQVDAEAGLHPDRPQAGDIKLSSLWGHAYWVRPTPVLAGGVTAVRLEEECQRGRVWLRLSPSA